MSENHYPQLAKTVPVTAAGDEPLKNYGKAVVEIHMGP